MRWALVVPAVLAVASCDEADVHILTAQLYDPSAACVGASDGVDVVNGPATGDSCSPTCLTIAEGDANAVYVTTVCPPFPGDYSVEGEDAGAEAGDPCPGAFAAYAAFEDSGVTCPVTEGDGGVEGGEEGGDDGGAMVGEAGPDGGDAETEAGD
ncbi:MAG TPA: hypothetical protein VGL81_05145 [Polyangiaceae bacterium]|jgi:hypothetical protein